MHRPLIRVATIALAAVTLCCSMTSPATAKGRRNVGDLIDFIKGRKKKEKEYTYNVTVIYTTGLPQE